MKKATKQSTQSNGSQPRATRPQVSRMELKEQMWAELDELRRTTMEASRISQDCGHGGIEKYLKDMMRALVPVRYLSEFALDHCEKVDGHAVHGCLKLFLQHMDELLLKAERYVEPRENETAKAS